MQRTRPHQKYRSPSDGEIGLRMLELGQRFPFSKELVRDFAHAASFSFFGEDPANSFVDLETVIKPENYESDAEYFEALKYHSNVQRVINVLDWSEFTGYTPLERASTAMAFLMADENARGTEQSEDGEGEGKGENKGEGQEGPSQPQPGPGKGQRPGQPERQGADPGNNGNPGPGSSSESDIGSKQNRSQGNGQGNGQDGDTEQQDPENDPQGNTDRDKSEGPREGPSDWQQNPDFDQRSDQGSKGHGQLKPKEGTQQGNQSPGSKPQRVPFFQGNTQSVLNRVQKLQKQFRMYLEASKGKMQHYVNPDNVYPEVAFSQLTKEKQRVLDKLAILASRGAIRAKISPVNNVIHPIDSFEQVSRLASMSSLMMPTFGYKMITKQLMVKKTNQATKQSLFLLIDDSGSMSDPEKVSWVKALVFNRAMAVSANKAVLYIGWFIDTLGDVVYKVESPRQAEAFIRRGFVGTFNGGVTNIENTVKQVCKGINKGRFGNLAVDHLEKPNIVVINDGQDSVNVKFKPAVTTHGFILGQDNPGMKAMIKNSNGHYERFM